MLFFLQIGGPEGPIVVSLSDDRRTIDARLRDRLGDRDRRSFRAIAAIPGEFGDYVRWHERFKDLELVGRTGWFYPARELMHAIRLAAAGMPGVLGGADRAGRSARQLSKVGA